MVGRRQLRAPQQGRLVGPVRDAAVRSADEVQEGHAPAEHHHAEEGGDRLGQPQGERPLGQFVHVPERALRDEPLPEEPDEERVEDEGEGQRRQGEAQKVACDREEEVLTGGHEPRGRQVAEGALADVAQPQEGQLVQGELAVEVGRDQQEDDARVHVECEEQLVHRAHGKLCHRSMPRPLVHVVEEGVEDDVHQNHTDDAAQRDNALPALP
mmetsp:Transcript_57849/g.152265  ORF Transcript_57849/g.152265 Transcript_57849/m.152265 type:complete len:212 (+) Transcript_57849:924-1559(+)